jgi:hypothetical protein
MTKWLLGLLLLVNIVFFALMQWGGALTADADAVALQAPFNPDKIRLISDVSPTSAVTSPASAVADVNSLPFAPASILSSELASVPKAARQCLEWGEFSGRALADVQAGLGALRLGDRLSQRTVEHTGAFWVYIPPLSTAAEVQRKIGQLKKLGVDDHFVLQEEGVWFNTISLGVFKTEEAARKFHDILREKGVRSAKVGERMSKLKFTVFVLKEADAATAEKIKTLQRGFPESELKSTDCN